MPSKQVVDRKKSAESVNELVGAARERAASSLSERFGGLLERGEKAPDWGLVLALLGRQLTQEALGLAKKDDAHAKELADDDKPRRARDVAYEHAREVAIGARDVVLGLHGEGALGELQMSAPAPTDATELEDWLTKAGGALRDKAIKLPKPLRRGTKLDREELADELDEARGALSPALKAVAREAREAQATQVEKDRAMVSFDGAFSENCGALAALLRVAGEHELAARVRPAARRAAGEKAESEEGGGDPKGENEAKGETEKK